MITLHAGESNGALVLWGEASGDDSVRSYFSASARDESPPMQVCIRLPPAQASLTEALKEDCCSVSNRPQAQLAT